MSAPRSMKRGVCPFDEAYVELADQELRAALIGGRVWAQFVRLCEQRLGEPWPVIREQFNFINGERNR